MSTSRPNSTPYPHGKGSDSSNGRRPAYSPLNGCTKPASSGQCRASSGRATSSVTRPPPADTSTSPACSGRSYVAFTNCTDGSVSNGPSGPVTNADEKSRRSLSTNTTTSPVVAASDRQSTSPL